MISYRYLSLPVFPNSVIKNNFVPQAVTSNSLCCNSSKYRHSWEKFIALVQHLKFRLIISPPSVIRAKEMFFLVSASMMSEHAHSGMGH